MKMIWRTCKLCNSQFQFEANDDGSYDKQLTYCPYCSTNHSGNEKDKPGKGIRR